MKPKVWVTSPNRLSQYN